MLRSRFIARKIAQKLGAAALVVWLTSTIVFLALRARGNPLEAILGGPGSQAGPAAIAAATSKYGLDQPLIVQYLRQLWQIATLQLGDSYARKQPVTQLLAANLPPTLALATLAFILAWILVIIGIIITGVAAGKTAALLRSAISGIETISSIMPHFFGGAMLILLFASGLKLLPATGSSDGGLAAIILPAITLAIPLAGYLGQIISTPLQIASDAPFALTSRARGAGKLRLLFRHSLRHAALPAIALSGWAYGSLLSGAVVVEVLFARQGLGRLLLEAATIGDMPVVIGAVTVVALLYVLVMLLAQAVESAVDPRRKEITQIAGSRC